MKKLYRICNPENPIERDEVMLIFRTEARFELSLTTRAKSLKTAYEKFLRAFNEACADGAIGADLSRDVRQWIEPRPYTKLIERLPHDDKPRRLSFDDDLSVFVGEVKDADGDFVGKWTYEEFGDDGGFFLLYMLQLTDRNADDRLTAEQIQQAIDLRESLRQKSAPADDKQVVLFEEAATMNQDVHDESKTEHVFQFEHSEQAIVPADNPAEPAQVETIDVTADVVTLDDRARRIRRLQADVQRGIIEIGFELIAAKKEIGHGGWTQWLEKEFEWTDRTARRFMAIAVRFGKTDAGVRFQPSALQEMLALPAGAEQEFIDEQKAQGKPVETQSRRELRRNIKDFNQCNKTAAAETPRLVLVDVDDDEKKLGLRLTADNPAEPAQVEYGTPLDSMRDLARQIFGEIISEADVSTLNAVLKELSRIRGNLRGQAEKNLSAK